MAKMVRTAGSRANVAVNELQRTLFDLESFQPWVDGYRPGQKSYARLPDILDIPSLIEIQRRSFQWFQEEGLNELFEEIFPIESFNGKVRLELVK
ncbi:MAG: hypothetical protein HYZ68_00300, partial [Chloroflexi bacterium]|nr:hypothetical protein [Chloroflexota bacterium]